jgi:hypothetical protein
MTKYRFNHGFSLPQAFLGLWLPGLLLTQEKVNPSRDRQEAEIRTRLRLLTRAARMFINRPNCMMQPVQTNGNDTRLPSFVDDIVINILQTSNHRKLKQNRHQLSK